MPALRFLFDQHVNARALAALRAEGVDAVHVAEIGLSEAEDAAILEWAADHERIVITRNYGDFAPLVEAHARRGSRFPGVLFLAPSLRQSDVGQHVRALLGWIARATAADRNPAGNGIDWLRDPESREA